MKREVERLKVQVGFLDRAERSLYYQKAKCLSIRDGDRSTKFFHSMSKRNSKRNFVAALVKEDGTMTCSNIEVLDEFVHFYQNLLGTHTVCNRLDESVFDYGPCVDEETGRRLAADVTSEEIRDALFSIHDENAPGPDGFSARFLKLPGIRWDLCSLQRFTNSLFLDY